MAQKLHRVLKSLKSDYELPPPKEAVRRKLRRAGDPVRAMEGGGVSTLVAYNENRIRLRRIYLMAGVLYMRRIYIYEEDISHGRVLFDEKILH